MNILIQAAFLLFLAAPLQAMQQSIAHTDEKIALLQLLNDSQEFEFSLRMTEKLKEDVQCLIEATETLSSLMERFNALCSTGTDLDTFLPQAERPEVIKFQTQLVFHQAKKTWSARDITILESIGMILLNAKFSLACMLNDCAKQIYETLYQATYDSCADEINEKLDELDGPNSPVYTSNFPATQDAFETLLLTCKIDESIKQSIRDFFLFFQEYTPFFQAAAPGMVESIQLQLHQIFMILEAMNGKR